MLKTISALALAAASMTAPAYAQEVKAPVAPVNVLSSNGLAEAYVAGGVAVAGIVVIAILAGDDDDNSTIATTTTTTTAPGT